MSYPDCVQRAVDYVEQRLTDPIHTEDVARAAAFSPYHFHRIFQAVTGESVTEYIRRRRLAEAAAELIGSRRRIVEVAVSYQFESQASFTKAFGRLYGMTPAAYRRNGRPLYLREKRPLHVGDLRHLAALQPVQVDEPAMQVVGMRYEGRNRNGEIPALWRQFVSRMDEVPHRTADGATIGLCEPEPHLTEESVIRYVAGVTVDRVGQVSPGMVACTVPPHRYAVFTHQGPLADMERTYAHIFGTWLPGSDCLPAMAHDYERYEPGGPVTIHLPIE